jgi:uncharacterized protein
MTDEELGEDREAIGGLMFLGIVDRPKRSLVRRYRFDPEQEYKIAVGDTPEDPRLGKSAGTVMDIDHIAGTIDLKKSASAEWPHPASLIPPKPYVTGAHAIVDLVNARKKVGVTANSHKVICNLLLAVRQAARERGASVSVLQKCQEHESCGDPGISFTNDNAFALAALAGGDVDVLGGTAWMWAREEFEDGVDTLFVDEAGQMSLANVLSVSGAARNVVLLGDPRQLAQPSNGAHPPGSDPSALEHVLAGAPTIADDRGVFLTTTWRMHPDVCRFVSRASYEGRLGSEPECAKQAIQAPGLLSGTGIRYLPVTHWGNRTSSQEEGDLVSALVANLLLGNWVNKKGIAHPLTLGDILVVAPFNAQVACVRALLPADARVGTVDKFQGQQAPVIIYTLATSTPHDLPRNIEFLYSLNRLNVAVSRAQALVAVVCSPQLLHVRPRTPQQLRLANALCLLVETAQTITVGSPV